MRHALLQGYSLHALAPDIIALAVFTVVLVPLGLLAFKYGVKKAKVDGTLVQYYSHSDNKLQKQGLNIFRKNGGNFLNQPLA